MSCARAGGGGASHAARSSAFQHASGLPPTPRATVPRNPHGIICFCATVFVVRRLVVLFFAPEVHALELLFHLLSRFSDIIRQLSDGVAENANLLLM